VPQRRLILFAKVPEPGRAKTRLAPGLGEEGAARLYQAFLDDAIALCGRVEGASLELWASGGAGASDDAGVSADAGVREYFAGRYPDLPVRLQSGRGLGERLSGAFESSFAAGADHVVITGSDHPTLPSSYLDRAFSALIDAQLVIGPSADGGYYAIGLARHAWPEAASLFIGVPWSTPAVLETTRRTARRLGLGHLELPEWYDVDDPSVLRRLRREADPASHTGRMLARLPAGTPR
jgi:rSAM/selenodomain-associated transferase 1